MKKIKSVKLVDSDYLLIATAIVDELNSIGEWFGFTVCDSDGVYLFTNLGNDGSPVDWIFKYLNGKHKLVMKVLYDKDNVYRVNVTVKGLVTISKLEGEEIWK